VQRWSAWSLLPALGRLSRAESAATGRTPLRFGEPWRRPAGPRLTQAAPAPAGLRRPELRLPRNRANPARRSSRRGSRCGDGRRGNGSCGQQPRKQIECRVRSPSPARFSASFFSAGAAPAEPAPDTDLEEPGSRLAKLPGGATYIYSRQPFKPICQAPEGGMLDASRGPVFAPTPSMPLLWSSQSRRRAL